MTQVLDEERVERAAEDVYAVSCRAIEPGLGMKMCKFKDLSTRDMKLHMDYARAAISAYLGETHVVVARGKFHSFEMGDRVHHIGRKEDGTVTVLDDGNVQVVFDNPTPRGTQSIGVFDSNWFETHPNWLIPLPLPST